MPRASIKESRGGLDVGSRAARKSAWATRIMRPFRMSGPRLPTCVLCRIPVGVWEMRGKVERVSGLEEMDLAVDGELERSTRMAVRLDHDEKALQQPSLCRRDQHFGQNSFTADCFGVTEGGAPIGPHDRPGVGKFAAEQRRNAEVQGLAQPVQCCERGDRAFVLDLREHAFRRAGIGRRCAAPGRPRLLSRISYVSRPPFHCSAGVFPRSDCVPTLSDLPQPHLPNLIALLLNLST